MRRWVGRCLDRVAPRTAVTLRAMNARAHSHRLVQTWGLTDLNRRLVERLGRQVLEGPFAGLTLSPACEAEHLGPYLLGVYESELDGAWQTVLAGTYTQIIDVGAKFGFYAVGLARRFPDVPVIAFDPDPWARRAVAELAAANGVTTVSVKPFCSDEWLLSHLAPASLVVSDCEGYEGVLFSERALPALTQATLIIEAHPELVPGVTGTLQTRLSASHVVHTLGADAVRRESAQPLEFLSPNERQVANREVRGEQAWLLCLPRTGPNQALRFGAGAPGRTSEA